MPRRLLYLILAASVARMVTAAVLELANDEVYYFLYALDLQPNYFDHPPGVALLIRIFTLNLTLTQEFFLRLGPIVCSGFGTYLVYRLGERLVNERVGWYAAILYTTSFYTSLIAGTFVIPDSPQLVFWLASLLVMHEILVPGEEKGAAMKTWVTFGLWSGLAIMCKVHGVFLWGGMGLYILFYRRSLLLDRGLYASVLVTLVVISPILWWNIQNEFMMYRYQGGRVGAGGSLRLDFFVTTLFGQLLYSNPINSGLILFSLWKMRKAPFLEDHVKRFLFVNSLPMIAVVTVMSLFTGVLPHWSGPAFLALSLVGAAFVDKNEFEERTMPRVFKSSLGLVALFLVVAVMAIRFYPGTLGSKNKLTFGETDFTLDLSGWREFSKEFDPWLREQEATQRLPENLPFVSNKWFPAAHIEYYVAKPMQRTVIGVGPIDYVHQYYWLNQTRPPMLRGDSAIAIIPSNYHMVLEDTYYQNFNAIELLKVFYSYRGGHMARYFSVYLMKDYKRNDEANPIRRKPD